MDGSSHQSSTAPAAAQADSHQCPLLIAPEKRRCPLTANNLTVRLPLRGDRRSRQMTQGPLHQRALFNSSDVKAA